MKVRGRLATTTVALLLAAADVRAKEGSRLVTAEMRANAVENAKKHDWARAEQKMAVALAAPWLKLSDDELWDLVTSQELPRDVHTNKLAGCPKCGKGIASHGNYPWKYDFWQKPWKLTCPNCNETYPKNDFHAFYKTALDEHGMFRKKLGDRSLLFNAEHPDPKDPLHKLYVDDGYGMLDGKGNRHGMIPCYVHWAHTRMVAWEALPKLARAYTLTDDRRYAHKAAVLLDRLADVYPEMDYLALVTKLGYKGDPDYSRQNGRLWYRTWENNVATNMARAYDWIYDGIQSDGELASFCSAKSKKHQLGDKGSIEAICRHIEDHVLLEILKSVKDGRIWGNSGMHQLTLATAAIALDRPPVTEEWLDYLFNPLFPEHVGKLYPNKPEVRESLRDSLPFVLVQKLTRDGIGGECGRYGIGWTRRFIELAETMAKYPAYPRHDLVKQFPKLKQCFLVEPRLNCLDAALPPVGDSGSTGLWSRAGEVSTFMRGFRLCGDPRMARLAWHYASGDTGKSMRGDVFQKGPEVLCQRIKELAQVKPLKLRCDHLGRYGQAVVQTDNPANGRALWIYYGRVGHSHADALNIGLYAKNIDMLPDLGYPEYTGPWPKRHAWTANTISHETLIINDRKSGRGGKISLFAVQPPLRVIDVSSKTAYPDVDTYRRTVALIEVSDDDSYVVDLFRAPGGRNHRLSYHGPGSAVTLKGLAIRKQAKGTFAGEDVKFGEFFDGDESLKGSWKYHWHYRGSGFMYLYDVERSPGPVGSPFTVDWKAEDLRGRIREGHEPHLRLHALTPCDELALASGDPPQNKKGNPRRLRYLIQSRLGENMQSQFVNVLEPYDKTPFIRRVRRLPVKHDTDPNSVVALAVELEDGTTDIVIGYEEPTRVQVGGDVLLEGQFGPVRLFQDRVRCMRMCSATRLKAKGIELTSPAAAYAGKVTKVDVSDPLDNRVFLEPALPENARLVGQTIHFKNDLPWDTTYDIKAMGPGWVSTGDITIVAGFKNPKDFSAGYKYHVNPGDEYVVPTSAGLDRP